MSKMLYSGGYDSMLACSVFACKMYKVSYEMCNVIFARSGVICKMWL